MSLLTVKACQMYQPVSKFFGIIALELLFLNIVKQVIVPLKCNIVILDHVGDTEEIGGAVMCC